MIAGLFTLLGFGTIYFLVDYAASLTKIPFLKNGKNSTSTVENHSLRTPNRGGEHWING